MGIRVSHQIKGDVLGEAAWASGQAQGMERRREQDRNYSLSQEVNAIREKARQDANARFFAQLQAQTESRDQEMVFRQRQYEELPERQQLLGQIENDLRKDFTDFQYSRAQQQQLEKIAQARDYITRNADGRYSPGEQENLLRQIDEMEHGIQPLQKKPDMPWPKEQDTGQVWTDTNTGATLTRDEKGNVRVLVKPDDSTSFANQLKLRETIADYAEKLYESRQMSENPVSWEDSIKLAQQFYGDLGKPAGQDQPVGDAETMADTILRQMMSPETYAAAKATGLPSADIYYMTQQLMNQTQPAPAEAPPESGDISKDDWMSNNENFNQYRQRFASGIPQSQIEEAYKNDSYVDSNNSAMADADHEVTTPYATWEELTDHQRENAYEKYLDQNKLPLGDRFGMAVSKVISKSDYENYQRREKAHKAKLLTEEQFQEKCQENPEFLWDFIKAPNRPVPATIDSTQVDSPIKVRYAVQNIFTRQMDDAVKTAQKIAGKQPFDEAADLPVVGRLIHRKSIGWQSQSVKGLSELDRRYDSLKAQLRDIEKRQGRSKDYWQLQREIAKLQPIHTAMLKIEKLWKQIKTESAKPNPDKDKIDRLKQEMTRRAKVFLKRYQKAA